MVQPRNKSEWTKYYPLQGIAGVTALHARFVNHRYPRHTHEHLVVGLVESGVQSYSYRGSRHFTPADNIFVVNPGEAHTGESAAPMGYVYRALYFEKPSCVRLLSELQGIDSRPPWIRGAVFDDPELTRSLGAFHRALEHGASALELESLLLRAAALLFEHHADIAYVPRRAGEECGAVERAHDYMEAHFSEDVSLCKLARIVNLSPWYFARVFAKTMGLPPHAYLESVRVRKVCALLDRGDAIASAALSAGYADQSHLTKRFRRLLGITPRQYISKPLPRQ